MEHPGTNQEAAYVAEAPSVPHVELDDSRVTANYANLFVVSSTPEEIIIDFALDTGRHVPGHPRRIAVGERIVLNPFTAKRLVTTMIAALRRYEQTFGRLEVDVYKRVVEQAPNET